ncbi:sterol desaturase family protein, partial [Shewanella sp. 0m-11]
INSFNPLVVTFTEWRDMFKEAFAANLTPMQRFKVLFAPPATAVSQISEPIPSKQELGKQDPKHDEQVVDVKS